jgi:hypothetical protein
VWVIIAHPWYDQLHGSNRDQAGANEPSDTVRPANLKECRHLEEEQAQLDHEGKSFCVLSGAVHNHSCPMTKITDERCGRSH